ncbi:hypothetical protein HA402_014357 [Bradysia odoriphaga]|nr:hypothetical protein HA402_014357 [Bradysia odoriphaga]
MKLLKLVLLFGLLFKTIDATKENEDNVSVSVKKNFRILGPCSCPIEENPWKEGVQEFHDGCRKAVDSFNEKAFEVGDTTLKSLQQLITKLIDFTDSNSTIVASSSDRILKSLSKCDKVGRDGMNIIVEYVKVFPGVVRDFSQISENLFEHIGELTCSFKNAVKDLGDELTKFMRAFTLSSRLPKCKKTPDYNLVLQKFQKLSNIVAQIDDTLVNECENEVTKEVYDSVLVLHLLYIYMGLSVTGIDSCVLDVQYERNCNVSEETKSCVLSIEDAVVEVLQAVCAVVLNSVESITNLLKTVVNIIADLNAIVKNVLGLTNGVLLTVEDIVLNLVKGDKAASVDDSWKEGVQEFYNGCRKAADSFDKNAFEVADNTVKSLRQLVTKLDHFTYSNDTIVALNSQRILKSLSKCDKLGGNGMNIIVEYVKVFPGVVRDFGEVSENLFEHIGELTCSFKNAVKDLGAELSKFMREFVRCYRLPKCKKTVDYNSVLQKFQKLSNIVAQIDDTLVNKCGNEVTKEVYDSVLVLHLLYIYMGISVTGIDSCVLDVLYERNCYVSEETKSCVLSIEDALVKLLQAVGAVVLTSVESITNLLKTVVNIVADLNAIVKNVLGLTNGVLLTVEDIVQSLVKGDAKKSILY